MYPPHTDSTGLIFFFFKKIFFEKLNLLGTSSYFPLFSVNFSGSQFFFLPPGSTLVPIVYKHPEKLYKTSRLHTCLLETFILCSFSWLVCNYVFISSYKSSYFFYQGHFGFHGKWKWNKTCFRCSQKIKRSVMFSSAKSGHSARRGWFRPHHNSPHAHNLSSTCLCMQNTWE